jgi:hypothetical protein
MTTTTPQSDQAATTPGRAEELAQRLDGLALSCYEWLTMKPTGALVGEAAALLRAQSAELLALRADKARLDFILNDEAPYCICRIYEDGSSYLWSREAIDAALNSPTQKSPAK